jgi:hypothetical protein
MVITRKGMTDAEFRSEPNHRYGAQERAAKGRRETTASVGFTMYILFLSIPKNEP